MQRAVCSPQWNAMRMTESQSNTIQTLDFGKEVKFTKLVVNYIVYQKMSSGSNDRPAVDVGANCSKKGVQDDRVQLRNCKACYLVKYCSVACQKSHPKQHKEICRTRAAERKYKVLFRLGIERCYGECSICVLSHCSDSTQSRVNPCSKKKICIWCILVAHKRGTSKVCEFCRHPAPRNCAASLAMIQKYINVGDAEAKCFF